ncbi:hypothetical protein SAICODRAFT_160482 [Saitoella complicata NRRL Y-17804]|uniref:uncharacterized protein n=1 Tax=Saitoella complicata (strain BCRC 22490 / CBS 7301 / JCM 7358 / NBRC 10748 / NRRL Y-17804) TaxID=698492 RepID=UPI000866EF5C|nr:uncharacterized protein SAICODRAFT_160482 [Saitoella complicata NRRL Y-17804]ODQ50967.1 hypothetical protein SAICODRAFT_160482 [Saitoella complicata NRRL Y-17804]
MTRGHVLGLPYRRITSSPACWLPSMYQLPVKSTRGVSFGRPLPWLRMLKGPWPPVTEGPKRPEMPNTSPSVWQFYDDFPRGQSLKQGLRQYPYLFHADVYPSPFNTTFGQLFVAMDVGAFRPTFKILLETRFISWFILLPYRQSLENRFPPDYFNNEWARAGALALRSFLGVLSGNNLESVAPLVTCNFHRCLEPYQKISRGDPKAGAVRLPVALEHLEDAEIIKISTRSGTRKGIEYNDLRCPHHRDNIPVEGRTYVRVDWDRIERNPYVDSAKEATVSADNGVITRVDVRVVGRFTIQGSGEPISFVRSVVVTLETPWMNEEETYLDEFGLLRDDVEWKIADINYWASMGCPKPPNLSELGDEADKRQDNQREKKFRKKS